MTKKLFLIHGRDFKPNQVDLESLWFDALRFGIDRDHGANGANLFDALTKEFIYYGDLSNAFLAQRGKKYHRVKDTKARKVTLKNLKKYVPGDFSKTTYEALRTKFHRLRRWLAGAVAHIPLVRDLAMWFKMPDMRHYWWKSEKQFGINVRNRLSGPLRTALNEGDDVMIIGHSLGTIVAYDVLSEFSDPQLGGQPIDHRVSHFVTLGSPLGIRFVQRRLRNWRTYPGNISAWDNVTAKDDYVSLDEEVRDDFENMNSRIQDWHIYNLAVKNGKTHQHHATGYLIHPDVADIVYGWMSRQAPVP